MGSPAATPMTLGVSLPQEGVTARDAVDVAVEAERAGYDEVWTAERNGWEAMALLGALAVATTRVRLGVAIVSAFTRSAPLLAMGAATCGDLSGGRLRLGIGSSSRPATEQWMGETFEQPLARVRDTLRIVRGALQGEKVGYEGTAVAVPRFRLAVTPPEPPPALDVAALGPDMAALAGREADGIIVHMVTPETLPRVLEPAWAAAAAAGRSPPRVTLSVPVVVDADPERGWAALLRLGVAYAQVDVYRRHLARQGWAEEADAVAEAWRDGNRDEAVRRVPEPMRPAFGLAGDADTVRRDLAAFRDAGVDHLNVFCLALDGDAGMPQETIRRTLWALAPTPSGGAR